METDTIPTSNTGESAKDVCDVTQSHDESNHVDKQDRETTKSPKDLSEGDEGFKSNNSEEHEKDSNLDKSNGNTNPEVEQKENSNLNTSDNTPNAKVESGDDCSLGGATENNGTGGTTDPNNGNSATESDSSPPKLDNNTGKTDNSLKESESESDLKDECSEMDTLTSPTSDVTDDSDFPSPIEEDNKQTLDHNNCEIVDNGGITQTDKSAGALEITDNDKKTLSDTDSNDNIKAIPSTESTDINNSQVGNVEDMNEGSKQTERTDNEEQEIVPSADSTNTIMSSPDALESPQTTSDNSSGGVYDEGLKQDEDVQKNDSMDVSTDASDVCDKDVQNIGDNSEDVESDKNEVANVETANKSSDCDVNANPVIEKGAETLKDAKDGAADETNQNPSCDKPDEGDKNVESSASSDVDKSSFSGNNDEDASDKNGNEESHKDQTGAIATGATDGADSHKSGDANVEVSKTEKADDGANDKTNSSVTLENVTPKDTTEKSEPAKTESVVKENESTTAETEGCGTQAVDFDDVYSDDYSDDDESESDAEDLTYNDSDIESELQIVMSPKRRSSKAQELTEILHTLESVSASSKLQTIPQSENVFNFETDEESGLDECAGGSVEVPSKEGKSDDSTSMPDEAHKASDSKGQPKVVPCAENDAESPESKEAPMLLEESGARKKAEYEDVQMNKTTEDLEEIHEDSPCTGTVNKSSDTVEDKSSKTDDPKDLGEPDEGLDEIRPAENVEQSASRSENLETGNSKSSENGNGAKDTVEAASEDVSNKGLKVETTKDAVLKGKTEDRSVEVDSKDNDIKESDVSTGLSESKTTESEDIKAKVPEPIKGGSNDTEQSMTESREPVSTENEPESKKRVSKGIESEVKSDSKQVESNDLESKDSGTEEPKSKSELTTIKAEMDSKNESQLESKESSVKDTGLVDKNEADKSVPVNTEDPSTKDESDKTNLVDKKEEMEDVSKRSDSDAERSLSQSMESINASDSESSKSGSPEIDSKKFASKVGESKMTECSESKDELKPLAEIMPPPRTPPTKHRFGSFTGKAAAKIERYQSKRGQKSSKQDSKSAPKVPSNLPKISISDLDTGVTRMVPRSKDDSDKSLLAGVVMRRKPPARQEQLEKRSDQYLQQKIDHEIRMRDGTAKLLAASKHPQQMLEAAKNLLTSNSRMIAYMSELQRRKTHEVLQRNRAADGNQIPCQGKVAVSDLRIPLMWKDSDHFRNKGDHRRYAVFCLWKIGTEIYDTTILKDVDRAMTDLSFEDVIIFNDIKPDFECRLEVYCHKLCEDLTMASTHRRIKKKFNEISTSVGRSVGKRLSGVKDESDFMSNMLVGPKFEMIANATLKLADITNSTATYDLVTDPSQVSTEGGAAELPLYGHFCCRLAAQPNCMVKETASGFLRVKNGTSWDNHWCQLKEMTLCCYDSPAGPDSNKKPKLKVQIKKNTQVLRGSPGSSSGQDFCFQLSSSSKFSKTLIFAADSESELEKWWQALQQNLLDLALWQHACDEHMEMPELPSHRQSSYISRQSQRGSLYEEIPLKEEVSDSPMSRILARLNVSEEDDETEVKDNGKSKKGESKVETDV